MPPRSDSARPPAVRTLTVFFCGTSGDLATPTTQIGFFARFASGVDITTTSANASTKQYVMAFDGCGVTNGLCGAICAVGIRSQAQRVVARVEWLCALAGSASATALALRLNVFGLSRGGIAAMLLAKRLAHLSSSQVELNLLLFDPVPGNLVSDSKLCTPCARRGLALSNASAVTDLRECENLRSVLAIYPVEVLPACCLHAPVFAVYPRTADVVEDVQLGCHQGALFVSSAPSSQLSFVRIMRWLVDVASAVDVERALAAFPPPAFAKARRGVPLTLDALEAWARTEMEAEHGVGARIACVSGSGVGALAINGEPSRIMSRRIAHAHSCLRSTVILRRASGAFLNKYHRAGREGALVLDIERNSWAWVPVAQLLACVTLALALAGATALGSIGAWTR